MPEINAIGELINMGIAAILLFQLTMLWRAYQVEVKEHREDLRKYAGDEKQATNV